KIRSNLYNITMNEELSYNYKLYYNDFISCEDSTTTWGLKTIDYTEDALGVVSFSDCAGNDTTIYIQFYATKMNIVPGSNNFGLLPLGQEEVKKMYVVNESETSSCGLAYLMLKNKDEKSRPRGFTLWDSTGTIPLPTEFRPPIEIGPLDSMPFLVKFDATEPGEFWDSIAIGDTCFFFRYESYVQTEVGMPIIDVSDWNFPPTKVDASAWGEFDVKNRGTVPLEIYDYVGPFITGLVSGTEIYSSQELDDKGITPDNPLILKPYETATFQVRFTPDDTLCYPDSIVFVSNTIKDPVFNDGNPIDSVCRINGKGYISTGIPKDYKKFNQFPNPADDKIIISGIKEGNISVKIIDILGDEIYSEKLLITNDQLQINTKDFTEGMYLIQLIKGKEIMTKKFVVIH
ncbi:T9SS type A sorting domain-containing protein, partial [Bacteroidota bacterium]